MNTQDLVKQLIEATAQGVRQAAKNRPHWEEDDAIEAKDKRKEMEDSGETVRVSTGSGPAKVTRKVSGRVRDRRASIRGGGHPYGSPENPMFKTRVVKAKKKTKQRSSTELIRGSRLALAERVIDEMYSGTIKKGSKAAIDLSNIEGMKRIVRGGEGGAQKTARVLRTSVNKVLNSRNKNDK